MWSPGRDFTPALVGFGILGIVTMRREYGYQET
jgi:hypothetical protein